MLPSAPAPPASDPSASDTSVPSLGLHALLTSAAFAPLPHLGWVRVTGDDRVRWLNGMVTNNIPALKPGQGNYNFFLNPQGRIQADANAFLLEDAILLQTARHRIPALLTLLERFIIMDDVELSPMNDFEGLLLAGPNALPILQALGTAHQAATPCAPGVAPPQEGDPTPGLSLKQTLYAGSLVFLLRTHSALVPTFELWSAPSTIASIVAELLTTPAIPASPTDLEHLRLLSGTPLYGTDIRNSDTAKDLPQETALPHTTSPALHFAKGCYLGQEIVERIRSRGAVHRTFTGFLLTPDPVPSGTPLPPPGTPLALAAAPEKAGELTSIADIPLHTGTIRLALGYIRREALERAATSPLTYPGGTATPQPLPYPLFSFGLSTPK